MKNNQMIAKIFVLALALVFAFILAACGSSSNQQESEDPVVEDPVVDDPVVEDPVVDDPVVDDPVVDDPVVDDPVVDESYCYRNDEDTLIEYWQDPGQTLLSYGRISRWDQAPIVKVVTVSTPITFQAVKETVKRLNEALPEEYKMEFVEDAPIGPGMDISAPVPDGEIHVEFLRKLDPMGWARNTYNQDEAIVSSRVQIHGVVAGVFEPYIPGQIAPDADEACGEANYFLKRMVQLIAHEVLHSLGLGHVNNARWGYDSIMATVGGGGGVPSCSMFKYSLKDREGPPGYVDLDALRAAYTLENGSYPEDIRIDESELCANRN